MRARSFCIWELVLGAWCLLCVTMGATAMAQDAMSPSERAETPRERELRNQLKGILQELDEIGQSREQATPRSERPDIVKKRSSRPVDSAEAIPHYELADTSIVSQRLPNAPRACPSLRRFRRRQMRSRRRTMRESDGIAARGSLEAGERATGF